MLTSYMKPGAVPGKQWNILQKVSCNRIYIF
jgi:hypothetical protein